MRIIQVITIGHRIYGAQRHVLDLAEAFHRDGHEILVVVGSTGALTEACEQAGIQWRLCPSLQRSINFVRDYKACSELKAILKEFKPDVVASHSSKAGLITRWVCYRMGLPNTFTAHGWSFEHGVPFVRRNIYRMLERFAGKISCKIITVANTGIDLALKCKIVPESKLVMIYNGANDSGAVQPRDPQDRFTMCMVAGFREQKDHATLIDALSDLKELPWQIYLLGDGPLLEEIKEKVNGYDLNDQVHFEGMVNNVPAYLAKSDILVLITNWEGLPISTLEALTFSLPVVASNVSGVSEQVMDNHNGLLVPRGDRKAVAKAIQRMIEDSEFRMKCAKNSRELFEEHFTVETMYNKTKAVYESIISPEKNK